MINTNDEGFYKRKKERTEYYFNHIYKIKKVICGACNGSGKYDHNGSPNCGACNGEGRVFCKEPFEIDGKYYG
jgi:DnaJ-class molecular chaperone